MSFRRKAYPELSDHLLNRLLGGVSGEAHAYPPPGRKREPFFHPLERAPVDSITSVYGLRNGVSHAFVRDADYTLTDGTKLSWMDGGDRPDAGSVVEVNYLPKQRETRVNDLYPGSVVRTLMESFALEAAGIYAQMEGVYRAGFIDTAEGSALDQVVALLGIKRIRAGRNVAEIELRRARNSRGEILVPAGTRILTEDGAIEYETLADISLSDGQLTAKGSARDRVDTNDGVEAGALNLLAKPIAGIESASNPGPSSSLDRDENDVELRARAKSFLAGSERGTLGSIKEAIAREGVLADVDDSVPGRIVILVHNNQLSPEQGVRLEDAIRSVVPAGIAWQVSYGTPPLAIDLEMRLSTADGQLDTDLKRIQQEVREKITEYFAKLPSKSAGSVTRLIGLAIGVPGVEDVSIVSATAGGSSILDAGASELNVAGTPTQLGTLNLIDPALATTLSAVVRFPKDAVIPEKAAIEAALRKAVSYLNESNAQSAAPASVRTLSWGKLVLASPMPGMATVSLAEQAASPQSLPQDADVGDYRLEFTLTRPSGVSQIMDSETAPEMILVPFERLSLQRVAVEVRSKLAFA